jgi:hypothetical protein
MSFGDIESPASRAARILRDGHGGHRQEHGTPGAAEAFTAPVVVAGVLRVGTDQPKKKLDLLVLGSAA